MDLNDPGMHRDWDGPPESVAVDELGYQSAGALSDVPNYSAAIAQYSYARSSRSVGSQGSGGEFSYTASEAAKSDIATICSGSITEDIEAASILSADHNAAQIPNNLFPSPPTSERSALCGNRRTLSAGRLEFAALTVNAGLPVIARRTSALSQESTVLSRVHDMGPPLSRSLLLQHPHTFGSLSQPGLIQSFEHVFTDDHSVHSKKDHSAGTMKTEGEEMAGAQLKDDTTIDVNPLPNGNSANLSNGLARGRRVRECPGRYSHLPLERFHQNADFANGHSRQNGYCENFQHEYDTRREQRRSSARRWNDNGSRRSSSHERYYSSHRRKRSRSRSPRGRNRSRQLE